MKKAGLFLSIFTLFIASQGLWAGGCPVPMAGVVTKQILPIARAIPDRLLAAGIQKVGRFNVARLDQELSSVTYCMFAGGFLSGSGDKNRMSSIYLVDRHLVTFNQLSWQWIDGSAREPLALHESLGALGYDDENYQLTLALWFLSKHSPEAREKFLRSKMAEVFGNVPVSHRERVYKEAGGITGIGGGGDNVGLEAKILLWTLCDEDKVPRQAIPLKQSNEELMALVQSSDFEADWRNLNLNYDNDNMVKVRITPKKLLHVTIGAIIWNMVGTQDVNLRARILITILQKIAEMPQGPK